MHNLPSSMHTFRRAHKTIAPARNDKLHQINSIFSSFVSIIKLTILKHLNDYNISSFVEPNRGCNNARFASSRRTHRDANASSNRIRSKVSNSRLDNDHIHNISLTRLLTVHNVSIRLGKRDYKSLMSNFGDSNVQTAQANGVAAADMKLLLSLIGSMQNANSNNNNNYNTRPSSLGSLSVENLMREDNFPSELDVYRRLYAMNMPAARREPASYMVNSELVDSILGDSGSSSVKRVPFTPRIG